MVSAKPPIKSSGTSQNPNVVGGNNAIKTASPDIVLIDQETLPSSVLARLIFEGIGGQELLSLSRNDIVNGQTVIYQPISNLPQVAISYNSSNIIAVPNPNMEIFGSFFIDFSKKLPSFRELLPGGLVSFDKNRENIEIYAENIRPGEEVQFQVMSSGEVLNGTIYSEELQ